MLAQATSVAAAAAAACVCAPCSRAVLRRLSIDAMYVGRATRRCARGAVTRSRAQSTTTVSADRSRLPQKYISTQSTRVRVLYQ